MILNSNINENRHDKKTARIYTKLKFVKSDRTDAMISYVSQNTKDGRINGVRQDSPYPKKICVVDKALATEILPNVLYDCTLIPMTERNGYVVIAANPVQFKAVIETQYIKNNIYVVEVKFGNKTLRFDPFNGRKPSVCNLAEFKKVLERRVDVKDIMQVVADFDKAAAHILHLLQYDRYHQNKRIK